MDTTVRRGGRIGGFAMIALAAAFPPAKGLMEPGFGFSLVLAVPRLLLQAERMNIQWALYRQGR